MNLSNSSKAKITKPNEKKSEISNEVEVVAPVVVLTSNKKVAQDIAKWGERKNELDTDQITQEQQSQLQSQQLQQKNTPNDSTSNTDITSTNNNNNSSTLSFLLLIFL